MTDVFISYSRGGTFSLMACILQFPQESHKILEKTQ